MGDIPGAVVAICGAGIIVSAAVGGLVVQVLRNARDIQAAWRKLHEHDVRLERNDHAKVP